KALAQRRFLSMDKKAKSVYAKYISGTQETAAQWKKIRDELNSDEIRLVKSYFNLALLSDEIHAKNDEASAIACFRHNGIELFNTKYLQLPSYLATLPFFMSERYYDDFR